MDAMDETDTMDEMDRRTGTDKMDFPGRAIMPQLHLRLFRPYGPYGPFRPYRP